MRRRAVALPVLFFAGMFIMCESSPPDVEPLLRTTWKQRDAYAVFTPVNTGTSEHERLGCWSVAFAQILYHHGLEPSLSTSYTGTYYSVSGDFDDPDVDMDAVVGRIEADTPEQSRIETARYLWYASLATGKDFGTGTYIGNTDVRRDRIETHYPVSTIRIRYPDLTPSKDDVVAFIRTELMAGRPLLLYVEGSTEYEEGTAHALVIDGIKGSGASARVHLNLGWEGVSDGWYYLFSTIVTEYATFDLPDRWIMSITPLE